MGLKLIVSEMGLSNVVYTYLLISLVVQVSYAQNTGSIFVSPSNLLGSSASIVCSWTLSDEDYLLDLTISQQSTITGENYYFKIAPAINFTFPGNQASSKHGCTTNYNQSVTVTINNLQCSDERIYFCIFTFAVQPNSQFLSVVKNDFLVIKAPPQSPTMRTVPSTNVMEQTYVNITCRANTGRPGKGRMLWKKLLNGDADNISASSIEIVKSTAETTYGNCTEIQEQTYRIQVKQEDQNVAIACFVKNDDFPTTDTCQNSATDLCNRTDSFNIFYGVANETTTITSNPEGAIYQGMTVTLSCQGKGNPPPNNYTWVKLGDENRTLSTNLVDNKFQLTLTNVVFGDDSGTYRCTVTNTALGNSSVAVKERTINVALTTTAPTTFTTTPTTTEPTTKAVSSGASNGKTDDDEADRNKIIIIVVVVVGSLLIIAIVVGVLCWKRRSRKHIQEPSEKPYNNNRSNLSFQNPAHQQKPDIVADSKFQTSNMDTGYKSSLSGSSPSFSEKKEDGLMYADLTYDNKPRSRKPMAINDSSSDYSDIQMPHV